MATARGSAEDPAAVELLQQLIRNACVSTGFPSTGEESRNAETLRSVFDGSPFDVEWVEDVSGRASLVARMTGSDPTAPSLALMGHTDVVPADPEGWTHDPFGGDLVDGEVWGRGAVDMLNQTAAMALAVCRAADSGFRPRGDLVYLAVPDEECGGVQGAKVLADSHLDLIRTDYAITEVGGAVSRGRDGPLVEAYVADKGGINLDITVRGTPSHSSITHGSDNALVKAAEVVRRLAEYRPPTRISDAWRGWVQARAFEPDVADILLDVDNLWDRLDSLPPGLAATAHACNHTTFAPTIVRGGDKINIIPGRVSLWVNVRPALGEDPDKVVEDVRDLLADLVDRADIEAPLRQAATESSIKTPLWEVLEQVAGIHHPGARLVPTVLAAQTDARYLRPVGITTYGFGVLSARVSPAEYWSRFHGRDERIDTESLAMSVEGWDEVVRRFLG